MEEKLSVFAENLNMLLNERSITKYRLAKDIGVSKQTVSNWCSGHSEPKVTELKKLADYFDISMDILSGRKEY